MTRKPIKRLLGLDQAICPDCGQPYKTTGKSIHICVDHEFHAFYHNFELGFYRNWLAAEEALDAYAYDQIQLQLNAKAA